MSDRVSHANSSDTPPPMRKRESAESQLLPSIDFWALGFLPRLGLRARSSLSSDQNPLLNIIFGLDLLQPTFKHAIKQFFISYRAILFAHLFLDYVLTVLLTKELNWSLKCCKMFKIKKIKNKTKKSH